MRWKVLGSYRVYHGLLRCRLDLLHRRKSDSSWLAQAAGYLLNCIRQNNCHNKSHSKYYALRINVGYMDSGKYYKNKIQIKSPLLKSLHELNQPTAKYKHLQPKHSPKHTRHRHKNPSHLVSDRNKHPNTVCNQTVTMMVREPPNPRLQPWEYFQ